MKRVCLDTLDSLAQSERRANQKRRTKVNASRERAMRKYKGADRSVTLSGVIDPPTKNAAKTAFAAQKPRLDTAIVIPSNTEKIVTIPSKL